MVKNRNFGTAIATAVAKRTWANSGCLVMTNPSHQAAAAETPAENNPDDGTGRTEFHDRHAHQNTGDAVGRNNAAF